MIFYKVVGKLNNPLTYENGTERNMEIRNYAYSCREKFKAAKGSVLFIDEAYSLVDEISGMYGDEAINTIVQ